MRHNRDMATQNNKAATNNDNSRGIAGSSNARANALRVLYDEAIEAGDDYRALMIALDIEYANASTNEERELVIARRIQILKVD